MILLPAVYDPHTQLTHRLVSQNNQIEMGVFRVLFGHRIRAGFCNSPCCEWDWCGGGNWKDVERLYSIAKAILLNREENRSCFDGLPSYSTVKPFFLDLDFVEAVSKAAGDRLEIVSLENLRS